MTNPLKPRASKLERIFACPGSLREEAPFPYTSSPAAEKGKKLHEAMALIIQTGGAALKKIAAKFPPAEVQAVKDAWEAGQALMPADPKMMTIVEEPIDVSFLGLESGRPDCVFVSEAHAGAVIIDWKFGVGKVEDPSGNRQLQAYAAGYFRKFKSLNSIETAIVQPLAWNEDSKARLFAWTREELRPRALEIVEAVKASLDPQAPLIASENGCRFCLAAKTCQAYKDFSAGKVEEKERTESAKLSIVTDGTPIVAEISEPIQTPMVIISAEIVQRAEELKDRAKGLSVTDAGTAEAAGRLVKEVRGLAATIDKNRKKMKSPVLELGRAIDAAAEKALEPLEQAANALERQVGAFFAEEKRKADEARAEDARKQAEAKRKIEEAQRAAEEAARKASEAKTKAQREAAAKAAQEALKKASEAAQEALQAAPSLPAVAPVQAVTGFKMREEISFKIPDFSAIPPQLLPMVLQVNEKAVKEAIEAGVITEKDPWISIVRTTVAQGKR